MARLRIRIELSKGGLGIPLHKLSSVISESQTFLKFLTEDIRLENQRGEWLVFDFDRESLNFTAEYVGTVTPQQVQAFNSAFDGTTSLRRDTIAQFLRITDAIGEDEVIGFGLYEHDDDSEPREWRCLSRRDALRIAEEVQLLTGAGQQPHLPSVGDPMLGARMFAERRDRQVDQRRLLDYVRQMETGLSSRIGRVEAQVERHSGQLKDLREQATVTEDTFRQLLSTVESFCQQATHRIEQMSTAARDGDAPLIPMIEARPEHSQTSPPSPAVSNLPPAAEASKAAAASANSSQVAGALFSSVSAAPPATPETGKDARPGEERLWSEDASANPSSPDPLVKPAPKAFPRRPVVAGFAVAVAVLAVGLFVRLTNSGREYSAVHAINGGAPTPASNAPAASPQADASSVSPNAASTSTRAAEHQNAGASEQHRISEMHVELEATEPSWISLRDERGTTLLARLVVPGSPQKLKLDGKAVLRVGNAGGLNVSLNGKPLGPLGPRGKVCEIRFENGTFAISSLS